MKPILEKADLFERKYDVNEKKFWLKWLSKLLFTLISVKSLSKSFQVPKHNAHCKTYNEGYNKNAEYAKNAKF